MCLRAGRGLYITQVSLVEARLGTVSEGVGFRQCVCSVGCGLQLPRAVWERHVRQRGENTRS